MLDNNSLLGGNSALRGTSTLLYGAIEFNEEISVEELQKTNTINQFD